MTPEYSGRRASSVRYRTNPCHALASGLFRQRAHDCAMWAIAQTSQREWPNVGTMAAIGA